MDKYEYRVRAEQIKSLLANREYAEAMEIANTIDWGRVKSISMLCTVSEIYKINRKYAESKEILLLAYDRYPNGRMIVYALCELAIKTEEFVEAVEYYKEFLQIAPKDTGRFILQYKLYEAQEVSLEERIAVLEEFKKKDYREKWAYELAYLYHRIGLATKCVEECDELILWFGEGKFVQKAMELKMLHQPLSDSQQEKYDVQNEISEDNEFFDETPRGSEATTEEKVIPIQIKAVEPSHEPTVEMPTKQIEDEIKVKTVSIDKYSTMNLQEELSKSMQELFNDDDSKKRVKLQPVVNAEVPKEPEFDRILSQEYDGQISIVVPEPEKIEKQITGQMDLTEALSEWEKMKEENKRRRIVEAKRRSLEQTNDIVSQLVGVIPGVSPTPLPTDDEIEDYEEDEKSSEDNDKSLKDNDKSLEDNDYEEDSSENETYQDDKSSQYDDYEEDVSDQAEDEEFSEENDHSEEPEEEAYFEPKKVLNKSIEEVEELFTEFLDMNGMREQIDGAIQKAKMMGITGNILITGNEPSARVKMALAIAKAVQRTNINFMGKVAKISGELLNTKDIQKSVEALSDGALIVEKAGDININTLDTLTKAINHPDARLLIIFEDEKSNLRKITKMREYVNKLFTINVHIPTYSNDDLVNHAKAYAKEREYTIDEMGVLALYTRIDELQTVEHFVNIKEVEEILDEAIKHVDKKNMNHLVDVLFAKRYDEDDLIILREKDFIKKK
ncbi:MAG: hypothetical protein PHY47_03950 [Lachnospiraceae bacterium]|nr:hypothetical protein [Lachnospiraceae bacterium]